MMYSRAGTLRARFLDGRSRLAATTMLTLTLGFVIAQPAGAQAGDGVSGVDRGCVAEIRRTAYGVPHVVAADHGSLGFGIGHAFAEDNLCELAEMITTIDGRRTLHFGAQADNLARDFYLPPLDR